MPKILCVKPGNALVFFYFGKMCQRMKTRRVWRLGVLPQRTMHWSIGYFTNGFTGGQLQYPHNTVRSVEDAGKRVAINEGVKSLADRT